MNNLHICGVSPAYKYDGWFFEIHHYVGPHPLNKNGDPRKVPPGEGFWHMWERFSKLSDEEKEKYRTCR